MPLALIRKLWFRRRDFLLVLPFLLFLRFLGVLIPGCFQVADADRCARRQAPERGDGGGGRSVPALISAQVCGVAWITSGGGVVVTFKSLFAELRTSFFSLCRLKCYKTVVCQQTNVKCVLYCIVNIMCCQAVFAFGMVTYVNHVFVILKRQFPSELGCGADLNCSAGAPQ